MAKVKDPVCGMEIEAEKAAAKTEHMGKTYYFCAPGCKAAFEEDPHQYMNGGHGDHAHHAHHGH